MLPTIWSFLALTMVFYAFKICFSGLNVRLPVLFYFLPFSVYAFWCLRGSRTKSSYVWHGKGERDRNGHCLSSFRIHQLYATGRCCLPSFLPTPHTDRAAAGEGRYGREVLSTFLQTAKFAVAGKHTLATDMIFVVQIKMFSARFKKQPFYLSCYFYHILPPLIVVFFPPYRIRQGLSASHAFTMKARQWFSSLVDSSDSEMTSGCLWKIYLLHFYFHDYYTSCLS